MGSITPADEERINEDIKWLFDSQLHCKTPKEWQVDLTRTSQVCKNAVIVLSRTTGDGKTLAIQGAAAINGGVTLVTTPNVTLTGFFAALRRSHVSNGNILPR